MYRLLAFPFQSAQHHLSQHQIFLLSQNSCLIYFPSNSIEYDQSKETHQRQGWGTLRRKRISLQRINKGVDVDTCSTSTVAYKGHFVVYSSDTRLFVIPLAYLDSEIFRELFQMSLEEFGVKSEGPIILPCDSVFMDYVISFILRGFARDLERALIMSLASTSCSSSPYFHEEQKNEQLLLCVLISQHIIQV